MLRLIHVINFAIIRLNEAERMAKEKDLVACFNFTSCLNNERGRHFSGTEKIKQCIPFQHYYIRNLLKVITR